jgi:hypothetical protein
LVFFLVFGASAAGKTSALNQLREGRLSLAIHDFDEIGVPADADTAWRHRAEEEWVRRALDHQAEGVDLLVAGQIPFGELLAAPSAELLESISACLIDCDDKTRIARLRARGPEWPGWLFGDLQDNLNWAEWMRHHVRDSTWRTDVIRHADSDGEMRWDRWSDWPPGDPRWRVHVIDSTRLSVKQVADELSAWIDHERALFRTPKLTPG